MATRPAMQLIRLVGGLALLAAAPLQLGATVIDPDTFDSRPLVNPLETPSHVLYWVAYLLTIVGLPAVHELQATRVGRVGAAGFLLALAGLALTMAVSIIDKVNDFTPYPKRRKLRISVANSRSARSSSWTYGSIRSVNRCWVIEKIDSLCHSVSSPSKATSSITSGILAPCPSTLPQ